MVLCASLCVPLSSYPFFGITPIYGNANECDGMELREDEKGMSYVFVSVLVSGSVGIGGGDAWFTIMLAFQT